MKRLFTFSLMAFFLAGCANANAPTVSPSATPPPTATRTLTPIPPTGTATPTPKPEIIPEYIQHIDDTYLGVQIHAKIVTDESLDAHSTPSIKKITVAEPVALEFIARTIFMTWWEKGNVAHKSSPSQSDFKNFMSLWSAAQSSKGPWEDVEFKAYANDMATPKYDQQLVTIWPMFSGDAEVPPDVYAFRDMSIIYVIGEYSINRTIIDDAFGIGLGTNMDGATLEMYIIPISTQSGKNANPVPRSNHNLVWPAHLISWYLVHNPGTQTWNPGRYRDDALYQLLLSGLVAYTVDGPQSW